MAAAAFLILSLFLSLLPSDALFQHPGVLISAAQLSFAGRQARAGVAPFAAAFAKALASPIGSLTYVPQGPPASGVIECGSYSKPDHGCSAEDEDGAAAYLQLVLYNMTGNAAHAAVATRIMRAYAAGLHAYNNSNAPLQASWGASKWVRAAELATHLPSTGWTSADAASFVKMLQRAALPHISSCLASNGNWGLAAIEALMGFAVITEDETLFDKAVAEWRARVPAYWYSYALDGPHHKPAPCGDPSWYDQTVFSAATSGVAQETCRDEGHTTYALASTSNAAETALIARGIDLWSENAERLSVAFEFNAHLLLPGVVSPKDLCSGRKVNLAQLPSYEVAYNALANRLHLPLPSVLSHITDNVRTSANPVDAHMIVYETLTHGGSPPTTPAPPTLPTPPTITIGCGSVSGVTDMIPYSNAAVFRYGAIPYAAPPLGLLRFRLPQAPICPWAGVLDGSLPQPVCMQTSGLGQEDCLTLSVYVPANHSMGGAPLPVHVYFHGGNLIGGSPPVSELEVLAVNAGPLITVGVAYRLNTLGFLAVEELAAEDGWVANQGVADAIASLEWVKSNIGAFGGDASRVTISGQSSGGTLIFALFSAPSAKGLFTGALSLSGSPNITQDATTKQAQDAPILDAVGCRTQATAAARVACLRSLPASTLARATPKPSWDTPVRQRDAHGVTSSLFIPPHPSFPQGIFGWSLPAGIPSPSSGGERYVGIVHVDGVLLTMSFAEALVAELVPSALIISNMEAEGDGASGIGVRNATFPQWLAVLNASTAPWPLADGGAHAARVLGEAYLQEASRGDPQLAYDSITVDYGLSCASRVLAGAVAAAGVARKTPLYVVFNAWRRSVPSANGNGRWPYHGLDWQELGWGWSTADGFTPALSDFSAASLLQSLVKAFGYRASPQDLIPSEPAWAGWEPVTPGKELTTLVIAQGGGYPGGGTRGVVGWKEDQCALLSSLGMDETYWWCD